ncbi:hypothetical protein RCL_jg23569.t1 [Rhizophagus clarus]|uniref:Uncharacterized protein n=1 Tax=Rhizophagus clarus TaxID=94130 RepID=A0A8H3KZY2_9GLOM|nr:hypothetical protein RCL_jg23569.t1 [Rhizophagus clarus]
MSVRYSMHRFLELITRLHKELYIHESELDLSSLYEFVLFHTINNTPHDASLYKDKWNRVKNVEEFTKSIPIFISLVGYMSRAVVDGMINDGFRSRNCRFTPQHRN